MEKEQKRQTDFIREIIEEDIKNGHCSGRVATRFPPEPNGYLHIGHAKSVCLNFGIASDYNGICNLRMDDTDPSGESLEYVNSIVEDVRWLGFDWDGRLYFASDYFDQLYEFAVKLIKAGKAYVCSLSSEEIKEYRGTLTEPGRESPYRNRSVEENLDLFFKMRDGEFPEGTHVLRAKIDMTSPNIVMRDPVIYRIKKVPHYRTGEKWVIYPMYDFAHCLSDYIEKITHSICTLEFENNRALYDWFLNELTEGERPKQIEFARLNLSYTILSKRRLITLVEKGYVDGWDDPRMPTVAGMRRRGYTPQAIRDFCMRIGVAKNDNLVDISLLEHCVREDLNMRAKRAMAVLRPIKVVIDNYPEGKTEEIRCPNHPQNPQMGTRHVPFSKTIYIEEDDFNESPPKKYKRLAPGREVRLRYAYVIRFVNFVKDENTGAIKEIHCTYDEKSINSDTSEGKKVEGVIHWVSAIHGVPAEIRLYDRLFSVPDPASFGDEFINYINPDSLKVINNAYVEPGLLNASPKDRFQFERVGYFCLDERHSKPERPCFNRIVSLRDTWGKILKAD